MSRTAGMPRACRGQVGLRPYSAIDAGCLKRVAGIVMREVQRATAGASTSTAPAARSDWVLFVHRFGAELNAHVHLHLCVRGGVVGLVCWRWLCAGGPGTMFAANAIS